MYTSHNTIKISNLRKHTAEVIDDVEKKHEPFFVFSRSQPKIVIMNVRLYQEIQKTGQTGNPALREKSGIGFFIDPPDEFLLKKRGLDAVRLIRAERD